MRKLIVLSLLAVAVAAPAQEAFQCVNPDVLNSLVFNARPESKLVVKRSLPDVVDGFRAPAEFTLIGSGVRGQNLSTIVAYKTTLDSGKAFESLLAFLSTEGWKREVAPETQAQPPMVMATVAPMTSAGLCRNGERRAVVVRESGGVRYAMISSAEGAPPHACGVPLPQQLLMASGNVIATMNALRADMPRFSLPESTHSTNAPNIGDNLNSLNIVSSTIRIESTDTPENLVAYLARQLVEQGWRNDAQWKGTLSNGSTWNRRRNDGKMLSGTLEILNFGANSYEVRFSMAVGSQ